MTEQGSTLTRHDLEAKIVTRCWEDEEFRREFTADPVGAFVKYLEVPVASLPKISVHLEEPGSWHIVLPSPPANADELSEEDLEKFAGAGLAWKVSLGITASLTATGSIMGSVAELVKPGW
jgi:hypothetical protein